MGLQEQIAEAIIVAFDELGGDPQTAVESALRHNTVDAWVQQETTKIAVAGGAEMIIPGSQLLTIPAGISYLMHKMAHISWGIGALKGAYIVETSQYSDLRNILTLWANASYFNAHLLDHLAIKVDAVTYTLGGEGYETLNTQLLDENPTDAVYQRTLTVLHDIGDQFAADERSQHLVKSIGAYDSVGELVEATQERHAETLTYENTEMGSRISARLAGRLAARISARVPARMVMGFIPIAGAVLNAALNAQTLRGMADTAEKYYDNALTAEDLKNA